jgi:hypothetical protein
MMNDENFGQSVAVSFYKLSCKLELAVYLQIRDKLEQLCPLLSHAQNVEISHKASRLVNQLVEDFSYEEKMRSNE